MGEADSQILIEDIVQYAMRKRNKEWKRPILNIPDDDPDIKRIFTSEIGKAVMYVAKEESWGYMEFAKILIETLLTDRMYCYGKFNYYFGDIGINFLKWDKKETFFSYCGLIVEVCVYCFERGYQSLMEATLLAGAMSINTKLNLSQERDKERYHRYAVQYNKIHDETFPADEENLSLSVISNLGKYFK